MQHLLIDQMTDASVGYHHCDDGGHLRYALLWPKGEPRGTILVAPGRREFIEKKHLEVGEDFIKRGYRLVMFEWRGQGLSDRFLDGDKRQRDFVPDFTIHIRDLSSFYERVVKPNQRGKLLLCGHSMGSHLFLRWLIENPALDVAGAILTAPMLALGGHVAHNSANLLSWSATKLGYGYDYAYAQHDYDQQDMLFDGNPLTHDAMRFAVLEQYFKAYPQMTVGGVTWEWIHAAMRSMHVTQRRHSLAQVKYPILTMTGARDRVTPLSETQRYLALLPHAENVTINHSLHDIMAETDACRTEAWGHIDHFLASR